MADGSRKRIDEVKIGDLVKTSVGEDWVFATTRIFEDTYIIRFTDGTELETFISHPFPIKNKWMSAINPGAFPEMNRIIHSDVLRDGDVFWSGQTVESITKTGKKKKLYNIILSRDLTYYANGVCCMTWDSFLGSFIAIFAGDTLKIKGLDAPKVRQLLTPEVSEKFCYILTSMISVWNSDLPREDSIYKDLENFSKIVPGLFSKKSFEIKKALTDIVDSNVDSINYR